MRERQLSNIERVFSNSIVNAISGLIDINTASDRNAMRYVEITEIIVDKKEKMLRTKNKPIKKKPMLSVKVEGGWPVITNHSDTGAATM